MASRPVGTYDVRMHETYREAADAQAKSGAAPGDPLGQPIAEARARQDAYFRSLLGELPAVASSDDRLVDGPHGEIPVRLVRPDGGNGPRPCIVFLRGAGFWAGGLDSHARTARSLALASGCAVCAIDYRRTPEHAYPVQRDEVLAVLRWLRHAGRELGLADVEPVLFGESAGATLALSAALALRDLGERPPSGLVLFYPNSSGTKPSSREYSKWVWGRYLGGADPASVPGPVPAIQPLEGLPPVWMACGEDDPLIEDSLALAGGLARAKVPFTLHALPALPHAFLMFTATLRPAVDALAAAAAAARRFLVPFSPKDRHP